ncbi:MAG: RecQ family ATP-dependent DNA helicase, partial [Muribaculaceae bacterium]|nr:RecQ family ATP-dependent DNA helicase [Muribaculaceae bacterium]
GKSICYQIPALLQPGVAVVVSPLIALMKDQVQALIACGIPAATINSMQSDEENMRIMESVGRGHIKLLYMSPERLLLDAVHWPENMRISLFAIDEAHCISQWGHDFRPEYARLSILRELFPKVPVIALTATADRLTRNDIAARLALRNPAIFISSFDRPNIKLTARPNPGREKKLKMIGELIERYADDSGVIYCLSRKSAEQTATELNARGYSVAVYHAGLTPDERDRTQNDFIHGRIQVVCATVAFGMGINKSNIRFVIHNNLPRNIEGYYQEIGRAGRDGLPAEALLFYSFADIATLRSFIDEGERQMINMEKLTRMQEYAETSLCRRRVLLSYFSEHTDSDCGNCDVCLHPPTRFDGTIIVQKALSAIIRCQEKIGANMLVDILRGSARTDIISRGYDRIRTYGAGRDLPAAEWRAYLLQMLQLGFIEIAYDKGNHLHVTPYGHSVLTGRAQATLARIDTA